MQAWFLQNDVKRFGYTMMQYSQVKKLLDVCFALILIGVTLPIMLLASIAIKLESEGPILFKQQRPGKNCRIFTLYKFRTMCVETEREGRPLSDLERLTKVGSFLRKTSIDELPQLFNILRGEMSFIGPRPLLVQYLQHYTPEQMRRHEVTPGISGWAQVNGRNAISWEEKFRLDVWYVDHISFKLDMKIFFMTIWNVIRKKGINNTENTTMPLFSENRQKYVQH
jgi:lipopolysaccharide/colanic/teichoic acid biosynthesis glycosyltransferase